jgi:hypothetical protein
VGNLHGIGHAPDYALTRSGGSWTRVGDDVSLQRLFFGLQNWLRAPMLSRVASPIVSGIANHCSAKASNAIPAKPKKDARYRGPLESFLPPALK